MCKKDKTDPDRIRYVKQRNEYNVLKRKEKNDYLRDLIIFYRNNCKKLWQTINEINGKNRNKQDYININGIKTYNKYDIAERFCTFLVK